MKNYKKSKELLYTIVEFMWRDLKLKPSQALIFTIIVNYKSYLCNIQELMRVTQSTEATVRKYLILLEV